MDCFQPDQTEEEGNSQVGQTQTHVRWDSKRSSRLTTERSNGERGRLDLAK